MLLQAMLVARVLEPASKLATHRSLHDDTATSSLGRVLGVDGRRLAAMANSFLTLGETVSRELSLSEAEHATVCTRQGNVVLIRVNADKPMTLTAVAAVEVNLAVLLFHARECAAKLETALRTRAA